MPVNVCAIVGLTWYIDKSMESNCLESANETVLMICRCIFEIKCIDDELCSRRDRFLRSLASSRAGNGSQAVTHDPLTNTKTDP